MTQHWLGPTARHDLARLKGRVRTGSARNRGEPLGVFLAASLNV
jgi:hypothetical protein